MAQDKTRGARSLMEAVAEVAPDLEQRRVGQETGSKGAPPLPSPAASSPNAKGPPALPAIAAPASAEPGSSPAVAGLTGPAATLPAAPPSAAAIPSKPPKPAKPASAVPPPPSPVVAVTSQQSAAAPAVTEVSVEPRSGPAATLRPDADPSEAASQKRRPAGPSRSTAVAANDDSPTIGGLIYALNQKPSRRIYTIAAALSGLWLVVGALLAALMIMPEWAKVATIAELFAKPVILISLATVVFPIAVFWVISWMIYQAQDLRLRSSAMTEVAIRLAEPDRQAEQAVASLGQTVRKQVNYMNDAISQAINRAGELEAMVHNEVAALDQAFAANEQRLRGLLNEFANQRNELSGTGDHVHRTLRAISSEVPQLLENLQSQQAKISRLVGDAGQNLIALDTSLIKATGQLETSLGERTSALRTVLTDTTGDMRTMLTDTTGQLQGMLTTTADGMRSMLVASADQIQTQLVDRTTHLQTVLDEYTSAIHTTLGTRTSEFQTVFDVFTKAIDQTLATRAEGLSAAMVAQTENFDQRLLDRTRAIDAAFSARLEAFDDSIRSSTQAIDNTVGDKARLLAAAMDAHAKQLTETLSRQSQNLDEQLVQGIASVRRTSENITRQSVKAIEGLAGQADMLKTVSENLLTQIGSVTNRFENQSQSILRAANALESANHRIDSTLQNRHRELTDTLGRVTESTDQLGKQMTTYKATIETSLDEAAQKTRALTDDLARGAQTHAKAALGDLQRLRHDTEQHANRALEQLRDQVGNVSREVSDQVGSLSSRLAETTDEIRARTRTASEELARDQEALRRQAQAIPDVTRQSADAMRRVLAEQLKALDEVSKIADREKRQLDVAPPVQPIQQMAAPPRVQLPPAASLTEAYAEQSRRAPAQPPAPVQTPGLVQAPGPMPSQSPVQPVAATSSNWSLGDLLTRASKPEPAVVPEPQPAPSTAGPINLEQVAAALDAPTAGAIWGRFRAGQRGILVRSIYSADGRVVFDDAQRRYQLDMPFRAMVDRFLSDFEREVREVEGREGNGPTLQSHLMSSSGRVYLFLAHASGRIS